MPRVVYGRMSRSTVAPLTFAQRNRRFLKPAHTRPYLLKYDASSMNMFEDVFVIAPFLVSRSHEMFIREDRRFWGGAIVESVECDA